MLLFRKGPRKTWSSGEQVCQMMTDQQQHPPMTKTRMTMIANVWSLKTMTLPTTITQRGNLLVSTPRCWSGTFQTTTHETRYLRCFTASASRQHWTSCIYRWTNNPRRILVMHLSTSNLSTCRVSGRHLMVSLIGLHLAGFEGRVKSYASNGMTFRDWRLWCPSIATTLLCIHAFQRRASLCCCMMALRFRFLPHAEL